MSHTTGVASDTSESGGLRLDLVRLAESYSAALSDLRASNVQLQRMEDTVKKLENAVPRSEIDAKRSSAESAAKKAALLRSIASVALELAEEELNLTRAEGDALQQAYKEGVVSRSAMLANSRIRARATANVKVLKLILSEGEPAKPLTVGEIFRRIGPAVSAEEAPADEPAADEEESVPGPAKPAPVELPPRR